MITRPIGATRLPTNRPSQVRPPPATRRGAPAALVPYELDSPRVAFLESLESLMRQAAYQVRTALAVADAGIDPGIEHIDDQVGQDEQESNHQDHPLDDRIVPLENRLQRSEERRVGKECRSRWGSYH